MIRCYFFGSHQFACTILQSLLDNPDIEVVSVITQPDKPVGRKKIMTPPPVKVLAEQYNLHVEQPKSLKTYDMEKNVVDVNIVAQYGKIIPTHIIEAPTYHTLNVHTSLLPAYRGASPIQSALIDGQTTTGVTIMQMNAGLDTGPIISQATVDITPDETYLELDAKLAPIAAILLNNTLPQYIDGTMPPVDQDDAQATHCKQFTREDGKIDWSADANVIYNLYRGLTPWPGIWTTWEEKRIKLLTIAPAPERQLPAGQVQIDHGTLYIGAASGAIVVEKIQLEGKPPMDSAQFISGYKHIDGATLS